MEQSRRSYQMFFWMSTAEGSQADTASLPVEQESRTTLSALVCSKEQSQK